VVNNSESVFVGEFIHSVDGKGRVAVPNAFRRKFTPDTDGKLVLARGPDRCIEAHTLSEWVRHVSETMGSMSLYKPQARRLRRSRLSQAREVELDGQGRILIPRNLKDLAGIVGEAVVIGVGPFFEMWEPGRYREYFGRADEQYDDDLVELDEMNREGDHGTEHGEGRGHLSPAGDGA
jgi:MraZ protein